MNTSSSPSVTIVGAGVAGLSAALALVKRGYKVTVYEATDRAGGNLGGAPAVHDGKKVNYEVFPHMYGFWYDNFWEIAENDLGLRRGEQFVPHDSIGVVTRDQPWNLKHLDNLGSYSTIWQNLSSGIVPVTDIVLAFYAALDLLTHDFETGGDLKDVQTVNGFLVARPYATEGLARIYEKELVSIWSIDSYITSALAYQCYMKYQGRNPIPDYWLLDGNSYEHIIKPWVEKLEQLGVEFVWNTSVLGVTVENGRAARICAGAQHGHTPLAIVDVENLILAVPQAALGSLTLRSAEAGQALALANRYEAAVAAIARTEDILKALEVRDWTEEQRARAAHDYERARAMAAELEKIRAIRALSEDPARQLGEFLEREAIAAAGEATEQVNYLDTMAGHVPSLASVQVSEYATQALLYVPFNRELPGIADYFVSLDESVYGMSYVRSPYLERALGVPMVLAVCISAFLRIPRGTDGFLAVSDVDISPPDAVLNRNAGHEIARAVLEELKKYIAYRDSDVIADKIYLKSNLDQRLFLNVVGSRLVAPNIQYREMNNVYFAVGTKENIIQITTVECSICGGLQAAQALWSKDPASDGNRKQPIEPIVPETTNRAILWAWKIYLAPWAASAKWWSVCQEALSTGTMSGSGASGPDAIPREMAVRTGKLISGAADAVRVMGETAVEAMAASFAFWTGTGNAPRGRRAYRPRYRRRPSVR